MTKAEPRPLVVCALEYERAKLRKAGLDRHFNIECSGPGARGVREWAATADPKTEVILAGLAGALNASIPRASVWSIDAVIAPNGRQLFPPLILSPHSTASITSTDSVVKTVADRRLIQTQTGADLVDLESLTFAQIASKRNWHWAIMRAVSDDTSFKLPADIDQWIDERGRTQPLAIARSVIRNPATLAAMLKLATSSRAGMRALANAMRQWQPTGSREASS